MEFTPFGTAAILAVLSIGSLFGLYRLYNYCRYYNSTEERRAEVYHYARLDKAERERKKAELEARRAAELLAMESQQQETDISKEITMATLVDPYRV